MSRATVGPLGDFVIFLEKKFVSVSRWPVGLCIILLEKNSERASCRIVELHANSISNRVIKRASLKPLRSATAPCRAGDLLEGGLRTSK